MKVALLLSGQLRNALECFPSIYEHILSKYNPDVYISTWTPGSTSTDWNGQTLTDTVDIDWIHENYSPTVLDVESFTTNTSVDYIKDKVSTYTKKASETNVENALFMWYKMRRVSTFISIADEYDWVIKSRFDLKFNTFVDLNILDNTVYHIPRGWDNREGLNDLIVWSSVYNMKYYCSLYDHIDEYYNKGTIFHPETMLKVHIERTQIPINRPRIEYFLRNMKVFI